MEVLIRVDSGLLIIIPGALIVHLCQNSTLLTLLKVHLMCVPLYIHLLDQKAFFPVQNMIPSNHWSIQDVRK